MNRTQITQIERKWSNFFVCAYGGALLKKLCEICVPFAPFALKIIRAIRVIRG